VTGSSTQTTKMSVSMPSWFVEQVRNHEEVASIMRANDCPAQLPHLVLRNGIKINFDRHDPVLCMLREVFVNQVYTAGGFYEPSESDVVIDCGANIGIFALYFEPASDNRETLIKNIFLNGLGESISVHPQALFSGRRHAKLLQGRSRAEYRINLVDSSLLRLARSFAAKSANVECVGLPDALQFCGSADISLLKLDVEGSEMAVLRGASPSTFERVNKISLEFHCGRKQHEFDRLISVLWKAGYTFDCIYSDRWSSGKTGIIRCTRRS
jgi:FkbM family methyltransferase